MEKDNSPSRIHPFGTIKAFVVEGQYILFLDFDADITSTAYTIYSRFCTTQDPPIILDTGIKADLNFFMWVITDIMKAFPTNHYTFTDIVHMLTHAALYYKKRSDFINTPAKRTVPDIPRHAPVDGDEAPTYTIYNYILKRQIDISLPKAEMKRFQTMAMRDVFDEMYLLMAEDSLYDHVGC